MADPRYTVNKSTLTNNDIPVLEQNWNHQRITANLPPTTIPPMPPKKQSLNPEQLGLKLYRNKNDDTPLPNTLDKKFLEITQIIKQQESKLQHLKLKT